MAVDIVIEDPRWDALNLSELVTRAEGAICDHFGYDSAGVETVVMGCDDARIATLNADFRGKPTATNVLSWPSENLNTEIAGETPSAPVSPEWGDVAISYDTCAREAEDMGKTMQDHVTHLIIHGILHLLGYDHIRDQDATLMEQIEVEILGKLGINDPYISPMAS